MSSVIEAEQEDQSPAVGLKGSMVGEDSVSDGRVEIHWCRCCAEVHVETEWPVILARSDPGKGYWRGFNLAQLLLISCLNQVQETFGVPLTEIGKYKNLTG